MTGEQAHRHIACSHSTDLTCTPRSTRRSDEMKHRVLIVDDDDSARSGLVALLSTWGYEIQEAIDGKDAIERAVDFDPAIVIADLVMPGLDGIGLLKALAEPHPNAVVILLTGYATVETAGSALRD